MTPANHEYAPGLRRGDVIRVSLAGGSGHGQRGPRYAIVVQDDPFNEFLSTALVIPTSTSARPARFRPAVEVLGQTSFALVDQVRALDPRHAVRVGSIAGSTALAEIDEQLYSILGLVSPADLGIE